MVVVVVAVDRGNMLAGRTADVFSVFFFCQIRSSQRRGIARPECVLPLADSSKVKCEDQSPAR